MLRDAVNQFVARHCSVQLDREFDEKAIYPFEWFKLMAEMGLVGHFIPSEYGGQDMGPVETCVIMETLGRGSVAAMSALMPTSLGTQLFMQGGTEKQRREFLPKIAAGEARVSFGLSEPHSGSDAASLRLKATRDANGDYLLNGSKMWTTGADVATHLMVAARTSSDGPKQKGITIFIVDPKSPGITVERLSMLGSRSQSTCQVFYDDVRVPASRILGGEEGVGFGWPMILGTLALERLEMAAMAVGLGQRAIDDAIAFVNDREAFGQKVSQFQAVRHMLADNATKIEAARALTYKAAALMAAREPCEREIIMAKVFATEACKAACLDGIQLLGGYGYSMDFPMQLYMRRSLIGTIGGGTTQVLRDVIGRFIGVK